VRADAARWRRTAATSTRWPARSRRKGWPAARAPAPAEDDDDGVAEGRRCGRCHWCTPSFRTPRGRRCWPPARANCARRSCRWPSAAASSCEAENGNERR